MESVGTVDLLKALKKTEPSKYFEDIQEVSEENNPQSPIQSANNKKRIVDALNGLNKPISTFSETKKRIKKNIIKEINNFQQNDEKTIRSTAKKTRLTTFRNKPFEKLKLEEEKFGKKRAASVDNLNPKNESEEIFVKKQDRILGTLNKQNNNFSKIGKLCFNQNLFVEKKFRISKFKSLEIDISDFEKIGKRVFNKLPSESEASANNYSFLQNLKNTDLRKFQKNSLKITGTKFKKNCVKDLSFLKEKNNQEFNGRNKSFTCLLKNPKNSNHLVLNVKAKIDQFFEGENTKNIESGIQETRFAVNK